MNSNLATVEKYIKIPSKIYQYQVARFSLLTKYLKLYISVKFVIIKLLNLII
jgi:hypothetical protein